MNKSANGLAFPMSKEGDVAMYSRHKLAKMFEVSGLRPISWEPDLSMFFMAIAEPK